VRAGTVAHLAREAGRPLSVDDPELLYRYDSLDSFLAVFWLIQELLGTRDDWGRIAYQSLVDAAGHGLRYREMFFTPARHLADGHEFGGIVAGLMDGIASAEAETGVRCMLLAVIDRACGPAAGDELVDRLTALRRSGRAERVIGVGVDSTELGGDLRAYRPAFHEAAKAGFRRTCHAGEAVGRGPDNIRVAVDGLGAERIDRGVAIVEGPDLVDRLAAERIPLTACPTSNVVIANRFRSLGEHPLRQMRDAGLLVTINTDDPTMEDLDLGREYRRVAAAHAWDATDMGSLTLEGIEATWLEAPDRAALTREFEGMLAGL
jgi:adenosine deaminase